MDQIVEVVALVLAGPLVGAEFGVTAFAHPIVDRLPDPAYRAARSASSGLLGKVMPFWYIATLVMLVVAAILTWTDWLIIAAAAVLAVVVLGTVTLMVPVNNRLTAWPEDEPVDKMRQLGRRWDRMHWLRVTLLALMFALLVVASVR